MMDPQLFKALGNKKESLVPLMGQDARKCLYFAAYHVEPTETKMFKVTAVQ